MGTSLTIALLSLAEIFLVTVGFAVFLLIRYKKSLATIAEHEKSIRESGTKEIQEYIENEIKETQEQIDEGQFDSELLSTRIQILTSEKDTLLDKSEGDQHWDNICNRMSGIKPIALTETDTVDSEQSNTTPDIINESDSTPSEEGEDNLDDFARGDVDVAHQKGEITLETSQQEIKKLRSIVDRQHKTIDNLKKELQDKIEQGKDSEQVAKRLEEVEISHAQLSMCVETLEKENDRLKNLLAQPQQQNTNLKSEKDKPNAIEDSDAPISDTSNLQNGQTVSTEQESGSPTVNDEENIDVDHEDTIDDLVADLASSANQDNETEQPENDDKPLFEDVNLQSEQSVSDKTPSKENNNIPSIPDETDNMPILEDAIKIADNSNTDLNINLEDEKNDNEIQQESPSNLLQNVDPELDLSDTDNIESFVDDQIDEILKQKDDS